MARRTVFSPRLNTSYRNAVERTLRVTGVKANEKQITALSSLLRQESIGMGKKFKSLNKRVGGMAERLRAKLNKAGRGMLRTAVEQEKFATFVETAKSLIHGELYYGPFRAIEIVDDPDVLAQYPKIYKALVKEMQKVGISKTDINNYVKRMNQMISATDKQTKWENQKVDKARADWEAKMMDQADEEDL